MATHSMVFETFDFLQYVNWIIKAKTLFTKFTTKLDLKKLRNTYPFRKKWVLSLSLS